MEASALTFVSLDEHIEALPVHSSYLIAPNRQARLGNALVATAGILTLVFGKVLTPKPWVAAVTIVLLAIEIIGLILALGSQLPRLKLSFAAQRREYAASLDFDMPNNEGIITWLRSFPQEQLETMSDFASQRIERFRNKLPLATGGIDKLGVLPLLVAVVIQFKDASWPPHPSWMQIILFGALMLSYWMCMILLSQRFRLELYGVLLSKALSRKCS